VLANPLIIGHEVFRHSRYGTRHPLSIPRVSTVLDLGRALGWITEANYREAPQADPIELARFHEPHYIQTLQEVERSQRIDATRGERYHLGRLENPIFGEVFRRPATAAGGCLLAATLVREGGVVHNPAGGNHHGRPDRASGFCYLNDPVLTLLALRDAGLAPLLYIDIDAHHGDGVEDAFAGDAEVWTLSVHERGRWPARDGAGETNRPGTLNVAVPPGFNDSEMALVLAQVILPAIGHVRPAAIVLQCGADALAEDPLSKLALSNAAYRDVVRAVQARAPRLIVLGGGGYNPWSVARCWTGIWGTLNGFAMPPRLPESAEAVLRGLTWRRAAGRNPPEHWFTTLADPPAEGPVRDAVRRAADAASAVVTAG
jgi:acetoin utilization protein AcuC